MELAGRAALVTGGGVRVGRALALGLAREGMRVVVHFNRSEEPAQEVVRAIEQQGGSAVALRGDLSRVDELERVATEAEAAFGGVDVLVNNASIFPAENLEETDESVWDQAIAVNLKAPFFLVRRLAPRMRERGGGAIVNLADLAGLQSWGGYAAHGISKAGLVHLTRVAARHFAPEVRVNAIAPGTVLPPDGMSDEEVAGLARRAPLRRIGDPGDVLQALLYLLRADFVTGELVVVDGGRMLS